MIRELEFSYDRFVVRSGEAAFDVVPDVGSGFGTFAGEDEVNLG